MAAAKKVAAFASEVDLCARFISAIGDDWVSYAETAGWDILLVRKVDGFQIGIQAKLKLNTLVLSQALDEYRYAVDYAGPDCRAILVPRSDAISGLGRISDYIGVTIIYVEPAGTKRFGYQKAFMPGLPELGREWTERHWHEQAPTKRHKLPAYVPDVAAGASAPLQLTEWKIAAIKIAVTVEIRGFATRQDFKEHRIDHRRWFAPENGWLIVKDGHFLAGPKMPSFRDCHPKVYEQIKADASKWMVDAGKTPIGNLL